MNSSTLRLAVANSAPAGPYVPAQQRPRHFASLRAQEAICAAWFSGYAFVLLVCYYQLRLLREPLLLTNGSAELKSYAQAVMAAVLIALVPVYGAAFRRTTPDRLVRLITAFFVVNLMAFYLLGTAGFDIGFAYYVWVGVFGATMIAQFWAHAAHSFDVASGQRFFPIVMAGATLGGLVGAAISNTLFVRLGPWNVLLLGAALLAATVPFVAATGRVVPLASRRLGVERVDVDGSALRNGLGLVLTDRYLVALAALAVLLNCVSTTGDYLLTQLVLRNADAAVVANPALDKGALISGFYGDFSLIVNASTVVLQLLLVKPLFRRLGVPGAILVLPIFAFVGYGLLAVLPIFALMQLVKTVENSTNYSLMNTARHALFLPLPAAHQYQGKTAIDGFFCRAGDLAQAGVVFAGLHWFGFRPEHFAALNALLAAAWIGLAVRVARHYRERAAEELPRARPSRAGRLATAGLGLAMAATAPTAAAEVAAHEPALFDTHDSLVIELRVDQAALCRNAERQGCEDAQGTLIYRASDGAVVPIEVRVRSRGRWRQDTGDCPLPALFVFFDTPAAAGTPFAGQTMLPLTTHCRDRAEYEQYVLKEYLAYRIYNAVTDKSLRVRLATITYRDIGHAKRDTTRFGFFTEHFDSLAARQAADVSRAETVDLTGVDAQSLATLALFQYMIGNTDWSVIHGHNTVALRDAAGVMSVVPYDFDFSGLVDAEYAGPPPGLRINSVRQRIFRGFCSPAPDWEALFALFTARRTMVSEITASVPGMTSAQRDRTRAYLDDFFESIDTAAGRARLSATCRPR